MAGTIYLPQNQAALGYNINQQLLPVAQQMYDQQQQQQQADSLNSLVNLFQQANQQMQGQNQNAITTAGTGLQLSSHLGALKKQYEDAQANGTMTPELQTQLTQQANALRDQAKVQGINLGTADQSYSNYDATTANQERQAYQNALSNQASFTPDKILSLALQAARDSGGKLKTDTALKISEMLGTGYNQSAAQKVQQQVAQNNKLLATKLAADMSDAIKNNDKGRAYALAMQLEELGYKSPTGIKDFFTPEMTPYQQQMLALKQIDMENRASGLYSHGRTGGGRNGDGLTPTQARAEGTKLANAKAIMSMYDPRGKFVSDGQGNERWAPYTTAEQIKFNEAADYIKNHDVQAVGQPAAAAQTQTTTQQPTSDPAAVNYDKVWRQLRAEKPDWTDQQVTDYVTYLINHPENQK